MLYFADADWWELHRGREDFKAFAGQKVTLEPDGLRADDPEIHTLRNAGNGWSGRVFSEDPGELVTGLSGGFQALQLAVLAGAARVVLLGYDMKAGPKVGGRLKNNWHNDHVRLTPAGHYDAYRKAFDKVPPILARLGVEVINATPGSALAVFPRGELESLLPDPVAALV